MCYHTAQLKWTEESAQLPDIIYRRCHKSTDTRLRVLDILKDCHLNAIKKLHHDLNFSPLHGNQRTFFSSFVESFTGAAQPLFPTRTWPV